MISKKLVNVIIEYADNLTKEKLLKMFIYKFINDNSYSDDRVNHVLELLLNTDKYISLDDVDVDYIKTNMPAFTYNSEKYDFRNIIVDEVDNIECIIKVRYEYKSKGTSDDTAWSSNYNDIDFIYYPKVLKKS